MTEDKGVEMNDIANILNTAYAMQPGSIFAALSAGETYSEPKDPEHIAADTESFIDRDAAHVDIVSPLSQNLIRSEIADRYGAVANAEHAISMIQAFDQAIDRITGELEQMITLAEECAGSSQTYTDTELTAMQAEFKELAGGINEIADSIESDGNKLIGSGGQAVTVDIGNGSTIYIYATDLSISDEGQNARITTGGPGLASAEAAMAYTVGYKKYLGEKTRDLEQVSEAIGFDAGTATSGSRIDQILTMGKAAEAVSRIVSKSSLLIAIQANMTPDKALALLTG